MICFPLRRKSRFQLFSRNGLNAQRVRATNKRRACATRETRTQTAQGIHNSMYYTLDLTTQQEKTEANKSPARKQKKHARRQQEHKNNTQHIWDLWPHHQMIKVVSGCLRQKALSSCNNRISNILIPSKFLQQKMPHFWSVVTQGADVCFDGTRV